MREFPRPHAPYSARPISAPHFARTHPDIFAPANKSPPRPENEENTKKIPELQRNSSKVPKNGHFPPRELFRDQFNGQRETCFTNLLHSPNFRVHLPSTDFILHVTSVRPNPTGFLVYPSLPIRPSVGARCNWTRLVSSKLSTLESL